MKKLILLFILLLPLIAKAQTFHFTKDSIPVIDGKIVFKVNFKFDLSKEEFRNRAYFYLNNVLNPYSGTFLKNDADYTLYRITDYINIVDNLFQKFGMYMTYSLQTSYKDGSCTLVIRDIFYMEKSYFEAKEKSNDKLSLPKYAGKDIMIDQNYALMFIRKVSERITDASLKRINEIIKGLDSAFTKKKHRK